MKIFGWEVTNTNVVIVVGAVFGGGACYALLKYLITSIPNNRRKSSLADYRRGRRRDGDADLDLPVVLEHEYGNFRRVCQEADPVAARYLQEIPDHFFAFRENFLRFVVDFSAKHAKRYKHALVIGSGTGGLVFRLAEIFDEVKGIEKSFSQVVTCFQFQNLDTVSYFFPAEGGLKTIAQTAKSPLVTSGPSGRRSADGKKKKSKENVEFIHTDLDIQPPSYLGEFQVVIIHNSLEDLDDPLTFLSTLKNCVEVGGFLFISSDYDWKRKLNKHTGFMSSEINNSVDFLKHALLNHFKLKEEKNIPEIICESARSSRIRNNHVTAWVRTNSTHHPNAANTDSNV